MGIFDIILIVSLILCVVFGLSIGLVGALGYLAGIIIGIIAAGQFYPIVTTYIAPYIPIVSENIINVLSFFIVLSIISKITSFITNKLFGLFSLVPFVQTFNRVFGALLGLIGGLILTGALVYMMGRFPIAGYFEDILTTSTLAPRLLKFFEPLTVFLPEILKDLKSLI